MKILLKELRERTGAGFGDCKKALEECNNDIEKAISYLRVLGIAKANKKIDRVATSGLIAMHIEENSGVLVELNCETDFVARNDRFKHLILDLASLACKERCTKAEDLKNFKYGNVGTVHEAIVNEISVLGEKLELSRVCYLEAKNGVVFGYAHGSTTNLGTIGALVLLESHGDKVKLRDIGKQIGMHIVAMKPTALSIENLDQKELLNERFIIEEQVKRLDKSAEVKKKIIDGRISKYYEDTVLLEQKFFRDEKMKIIDFINSKELVLGCPIKLADYKLFSIGN
ncbi:translation elongation factor Ts [Wolbachia endosymbiont of Pentidionis agamae]|uniref:translation elongation factor Ts n=1 Tax=Wolbachia endosymbiont of Pentidionis agamae TaxID=3110435 RepID=UPI002FD3A3FB